MSQSDIEIALTDAWDRVKGFLKRNPLELGARLARRNKPLLTRPPRAFCIAVRANDRRINLVSAILSPERSYRENQAHDVTLDKRLLLKLCEAADLPVLGQDIHGAAKALGTSTVTLNYGMRHGHYQVKRIKNYMGRRVDVPIVWRDELSDPCHGAGFKTPDRVWGSQWRFLPAELDDAFEQEIIRIPVHSKRGRGKPLFRGWRWVCPGCKAKVKSIFCPVRIRSIGEYLREEAQLVGADANGWNEPAKTFACHDCHRVRYWTSTTHNAWNQLIAYFSGGLLYGAEVQMPDWFQVQRKRTYRPHKLNSPQGDKVEEMLLMGKSYQQIAEDMQLALGTVQGHVRRLYKRRGVHSRDELIKLRGVKRRAMKIGFPMEQQMIG